MSIPSFPFYFYCFVPLSLFLESILAFFRSLLTLCVCSLVFQLGPKAEDVSKPTNPFVFSLRFILGALAGAYYVLVPIYMWLKDQIVPKGQPI